MATEVTGIEATAAGAPVQWSRALWSAARSQVPATMVHIHPTAADTPLTAEDTAMNIVRPVPTAPTVAMAGFGGFFCGGGATFPGGGFSWFFFCAPPFCPGWFFWAPQRAHRPDCRYLGGGPR